ncbi:MAG: glycosyltransferase family 4 protein [Bacteroidales bacterium]|jgi:glycosyltransferase involved in cell wall biosynthesis|nr:glycosyltransferase family 4 protein [Bacteroidales bacterium]
MRVGVNARLLLKGRLEGIGYFAKETLSRIVKAHPDVEFVFFFDRKYDSSFVFASNVTPVVIPLPTRHPLLWWIYFEILLPFYLKRYKVDVFFSPDGWMPQKPSIPTLNTIHDINFWHNGSFIRSFVMRKYYFHFFPRFAKNCTRLITVSEFSRRDIIEAFGLTESKISVVYNAPNEAYKPLDETERQKVRTEYTNGKPFFYFVGALHKRKNLEHLFKAFDAFKNRTKSDVKLVIIGSQMWKDADMETAYDNMVSKADVVFTGRLEADRITRIAAASLALVFVSYFEGFGIPIVEAFAAQTAVITSTTTSMPEVSGEAALLCEPTDTDSIATAMQNIYSKPDLRLSLIEKSKTQLQLFNWESSAAKLWSNIISIYYGEIK